MRLGATIKIPVHVVSKGFFFIYLGDFLRYAKKVSLLRFWLFFFSGSILIIWASIIIISWFLHFWDVLFIKHKSTLVGLWWQSVFLSLDSLNIGFVHWILIVSRLFKLLVIVALAIVALVIVASLVSIPSLLLIPIPSLLRAVLLPIKIPWVFPHLLLGWTITLLHILLILLNSLFRFSDISPSIIFIILVRVFFFKLLLLRFFIVIFHLLFHSFCL